MVNFEYKIVPAPVHGMRVRGVSEPEERFALSLEAVINEWAAEGWEYMRSETLPSSERTGLVGSGPVYRGILVFRRPATAKPKVEEPQPANEKKLLEKRRKPLLVRPKDDLPPVRVRSDDPKPVSPPEEPRKSPAPSNEMQLLRGNSIESAMSRARQGAQTQDTAPQAEAPLPVETTEAAPIELDEADQLGPVDLSEDEPEVTTAKSGEVKLPPRQDTGISGLLRRRAALIQAATESGQPRPAPLADLATLFADAEDAEEIIDDAPAKTTAAE